MEIWLIINSWIYSIHILFIINRKKSKTYQMYNIEHFEIDPIYSWRLICCKGIGVRPIACIYTCKCIFTLSRSKILRPRYENTWICKNSTICRDISLFLAAQFIFSSCFRLYSKHRSSFSVLELCFYDVRELTCLKIGRNSIFFAHEISSWIFSFVDKLNIDKFK